jgi:hypothetical protein
MSILGWIYSKKEEDEYLRMRFDANDKSWQVMKGMEVMYFGTEDECKEFMNLNRK